MTPYERGYAAGQIAMRERAAAECYAESVRWQNENGEHQPAQALCAARILSLPIQGEADQRGVQEGSCPAAGSSPAVPHHNAGTNANQPVAESQAPAPSEPGDRGVAPTLADSRPARPGPSQECVVVPTKIGVLHRSARHGTHFIQSASVIPLGIHETMDVYAMLAAAKEEHDAHR